MAEPTPVTPIAIQPAAGVAPLAPAKPEGNGGYTRPFGNERRNSRLTASLGPGPFRIRWQVELEEQLQPRFVLNDGDRSAIVGVHEWMLFANDGTRIKGGGIGEGEASLDREHQLLYAPSPSGMIVAYHAKDGSVAFLTNGYGGRHNVRTLIVRRGNLLLDVSPGAKIQPRARPMIFTGLQVQDIGATQQVDESQVLQNAVPQASEERNAANLLSAMHGDTLILAFMNRIQFLDGHLKVSKELSGEFEPRLMSLDESGRIYLVAMTDHQHWIWIVSSDGQQLARLELKAEYLPLIAPPIVGYDHRVYLANAHHIVAVGDNGRVLWEENIADTIAGAVITPDDQLLVAAGREILSFDSLGGRKSIFHAVEDGLATPPILIGNGEILVASKRRLYCVAR